MCVWMGVLGCKDASVKAFDMLKKTEGIWGGFYTGVVSLENNKFHSGKVLGSTEEWNKKFIPFPGLIALAHSRTASGGGCAWGHPFVTSEVAVVAQGSSGIFKHERVHFAKVGNRLLRDGVKFDSSDFNLPPEKYITLSDGSLVHFTEIVVQAVNREFIKCGNHVEAIRRGLEGLSLEVVFAFIFRDDFNAFYLANVNQRAIFGKTSNAIYLGTTALAFPQEITELTEVPENTIAKIGYNEVSFQHFSIDYNEISKIPKEAEEAFILWLSANPGVLLSQITDNALRPLFPKETLVQTAVCAWQILEKLYFSGRIKFKPVSTPYMGTIGKLFYIHLIE